MLSKRFLRVLIVVNLILFVVSPVAFVVNEDWLPEPLRAFEQARETEITTADWIQGSVDGAAIIAALVACIGLLVFWRPARPLYFCAIILGTLVTSLGGPDATSGWVEAIEGVSDILAGVVLALIYFSPLKDLYDKTNPAAPMVNVK